ncbi:lecithin retinol acyltransferase family protein [Cupriavidus pauculus]|uniref:lecithin retinol acyltransferase family protein n=1 Tax=Cupriavidus pauculus TaxID=82633 RepID=UPI0009FF2E50|nr:lecithin retinol acyltransferase family protein [Cupriavidus pauculus]
MSTTSATPGADATSQHCVELPQGAHLVTVRRWYYHHGIYVGNGQVIHYAGFKSPLHCGPVECTSLGAFADGEMFEIAVEGNAVYSRDDVVLRATSRLGEDRYHLFFNNCEHFCTWCLFNTPRSHQVRRLLCNPLHALIALTYLIIAVSSSWLF